jgi:hypothetical protein
VQLLREAVPEDTPTMLRLMLASFREYADVLDPPSAAHSETIDTVRKRQRTQDGYAEPTFVYMEKILRLEAKI